MNLYDKLKGFKAPELDDIGNMTVNEIIDILKSNVKHNAGVVKKVSKEVGKEAKTTLKQEIGRISQLYQDVKGENSEFDNLIQTLEAQLTELRTKLEDNKSTENKSNQFNKNNPNRYVITDDSYFDSSDIFDGNDDDIVVTIQFNQDSNQFEISFYTNVDIYDSEEIESFCEAAINDYKELQLIGPATFCYTYEEIFDQAEFPFDEDEEPIDEDEEPEKLEDMDTDEVINGMPFREFLEIIRDDVEEHFNVTRKGKNH